MFEKSAKNTVTTGNSVDKWHYVTQKLLEIIGLKDLVINIQALLIKSLQAYISLLHRNVSAQVIYVSTPTEGS